MEILNNLTFQTILGAFLGALLGWLFSLISSKSKSEYSNLTIIETRTIVKNEYRSERQNESTDSTGILFIVLFALAYGAFGYVKFNEVVFSYVFLFNVFSYAFILSTFIIALVLGRVGSKEWVFRFLFPIIIFIFTTVIFKYLKNNIPEMLIEKANSVEIFDFIKNLTPYGRNFLTSQLLSFVLNILVSILSLINFVNYFALMNRRGSKGLRIWYYIDKYTKIGSGNFYYIFSIILLIMIVVIQTEWFKITVLMPK